MSKIRTIRGLALPHECKELSDWTLEAYAKGQMKNVYAPGIYTLLPGLPKTAMVIRHRLCELTGLPMDVEGDNHVIVIDNVELTLHIDVAVLNGKHARCNIVMKKPDSGGLCIGAEDEYGTNAETTSLEEGDGWICCVDRVAHGVSKVTGIRVGLSLGFLMPAHWDLDKLRLPL